MKIVHVTDVYAPGLGGIERQVQSLAERQAAAGHQVTVVTTASPRSASTASTGWSPWLGGEHGHRGTVAVCRRGWPRVVLAPGLPTNLTADVVHGHLSVLSPLTVRATAAAARAGIPVALTVHSMWPRRAGALRALLAAIGGLPPSGTRVAWSAVSAAAADRLRTALPGEPPVIVVPNIVDTHWWRPPQHLDSDRELHLVLVNRLARRKRVAPFVTLLAQDFPPSARVTIVGEGPRRAAIEATVRRHRLSDQITLTGALTSEAVRQLLHRADVFVAPARLESFGIAALEARAAGLPVVGFADTGLADFITDGLDGRLVHSDQQLHAVVRQFARERDALTSLQQAARDRPPATDARAATSAVGALYRLAVGDRRWFASLPIAGHDDSPGLGARAAGALR